MLNLQCYQCGSSTIYWAFHINIEVIQPFNILKEIYSWIYIELKTCGCAQLLMKNCLLLLSQTETVISAGHLLHSVQQQI